jgi:hypothetical protein
VITSAEMLGAVKGNSPNGATSLRIGTAQSQASGKGFGVSRRRCDGDVLSRLEGRRRAPWRARQLSGREGCRTGFDMVKATGPPACRCNPVQGATASLAFTARLAL